jgi:hypothetical protein
LCACELYSITGVAGEPNHYAFKLFRGLGGRGTKLSGQVASVDEWSRARLTIRVLRQQ